MKLVFAVASFGGHWEQLQWITHCFKNDSDLELVYCSTRQIDASILQVSDCNARRPLAVLICFWQMWRLLRMIRPDIILTTGAAPGLMALVAGRVLGVKKRIWIDSVANSEKLSLSGRLAKYAATTRLTQWPHLAGEADNDPRYIGRIL